MIKRNIRTILIILAWILFGLLVIWLWIDDGKRLNAQEIKQPPPQQKIKTWRMPADLHQGLVKMVEDFNKEYNAKIEIYKQVLRSSSDEFADMPEDAVFDLQSGVFLSQNDYKMLQERAKKLQEQVIKEKASGEMKKEAENEVKK